MSAPRTENGDLVKPRLRDKKDIAQGGYIRLVLDFCFWTGLVIGNHPDPLHWHHIYGHRLINQVSHHSCHQTHPPPQIHKKMVLLVTSDNEQFHADKEVVERSVLIKNMLEGVTQRHRLRH